MNVLWACVVAEQSDDPDSGGRDDRHEALSLLASFLALWAGTAMLLSRLPWFRDSVSLVDRLAS